MRRQGKETGVLYTCIILVGTYTKTGSDLRTSSAGTERLERYCNGWSFQLKRRSHWPESINDGKNVLPGPTKTFQTSSLFATTDLDERHVGTRLVPFDPRSRDTGEENSTGVRDSTLGNNSARGTYPISHMVDPISLL